MKKASKITNNYPIGQSEESCDKFLKWVEGQHSKGEVSIITNALYRNLLLAPDGRRRLDAMSLELCD